MTLHFHEVETKHVARRMEACSDDHDRAFAEAAGPVDAVIGGVAMHSDGTLGLPLPLCSRCERPSDELIDRAHGERICLGCRNREAERFELATGRCHHADCHIELAFHTQPRHVADECPSEAEARVMEGNR